MASIISRLDNEEIDLNPDFQRNQGLWSNKKMSRLIESILLRLPLPVFYFDVTDNDKWIVVDGLQRLSTLKKFIVDKKLRLQQLEFLSELNGCSYNDLERPLKRVIDETQVITYQIEAQTPKEVRYSIFNRINTGGVTLNAQEIRQALNQNGIGVKFLKDIANDVRFKRIVGIKSDRMMDRELALRFIAFKLIKSDDKYKDMSNLLDLTMDKLDHNYVNDDDRLNEIKQQLFSSLEFSEELLGEGHKFSRNIANVIKNKAFNHALFDSLTVGLSELNEYEKASLLSKKDIFKNKFINLLRDTQSDFSKSITVGTSGKFAIEMRFKTISNLINEVINE